MTDTGSRNQAADLSYPVYHIAPPAGWLNDPNGLCQMDGIYHIYFQYAPESAKGGLKHWGHCRSRDLIHWTFTGPVLFPDSIYDKDGVYSGSALAEEGKIYLYYTGNVKEEGIHDYISSGRGANTMLAVTPDGCSMGEKQCLMTNADYPEDVTCHVRDPKVFRDGADYYMVQGARTKADQGIVLLFQSRDKIHWRYHSRIRTAEPFGYMWECPDLFPLGDRTVLSVSPQGLEREEYRFQNRYQSGYYLFTGDYRQEQGYELQSFREWDMGFDFYAPQTFEDEKGRRILIGWAGMADCEEEYDNHLTVERGWQHMLTLPRELILKDDMVYQRPAEEIRSLRKNERSIELPGGRAEFICGTAAEILMEELDGEHLTIRLGSGLWLRYEKDRKVFSMEFTDDTGSGRTVRKARTERLDSLNLFLDRSVIEVYLNDGSCVFTSRFYPEAEELRVIINGGCGRLRKWDLF